MKKITVLILVGDGIKDASLSLSDLYARAVDALKSFSDIEYSFLLAVNNYGTDAFDFCEKFAFSKSNVTVFVPPYRGGEGTITDEGAGRYTFGLFEAAKLGDFVLEIDAGGAHNPDFLPVFVQKLLEGNKAVLSTRFSLGGKNYYPLQRRLASMGITLMANLFLGLGRKVTDMASGFEAFESKFLLSIFEICPPSDWISMHTTTAFIQTELRSYVFWLIKVKHKRSALYSDIAVVPIQYGEEKAGVIFPISVGKKSLRAFFQLFFTRSSFMRKSKKAQV